MAKFCMNCGSPLTEGARFCENCGAPVPAEIEPVVIDAPEGSTVTVSDTPPAPPPKQRRTGRRKTSDTRPKETPEKARRAKPERSQSESGGKRGLSLLLAVVMVVELGVIGFKCPGILRKEPGETAGRDSSAESENTADLLALFGGEEAIASYTGYDGPITVENSPGNPELLSVSYSQAEHDSAPTLTQTVTWENPSADFPELGIHVDFNWWNLKNASDTLTVKQLPVKTDERMSGTVYAYSFTLSSGQHEFATDVAITIPNRCPDGQYSDIVYFNEERGVWESVYYTVSEDGKTCTLYMDHFTDGAQVVFEEGMSYQQTYGPHCLLFEYRNQKDELMQPLAPALYPVGVVETPDFEAVARRETARSKKLTEAIMKGGGVPAEYGVAEGCDFIGMGSDGVSTALTALGAITKTTAGITWLGYGLTAMGTFLLKTRMIDQIDRGVKASAIKSSNAMGLISTGVGTMGTLADIAGFAAASTALSYVAVVLFLWTAGEKYYENEKKARDPIGDPKGFQDLVYHRYLLWGNPYIVNGHTLSINGAGFADTLKELFEEYGGQFRAEELGVAVDKLYNDFINYYWDVLTYEDRVEAAKPVYNLEYGLNLNTTDNYWDSPAALTDLPYVQVQAEKTWADKYMNYTDPSKEEIEQYKERAMETLCATTSPILYELYQAEYRASIVKARQQFYQEVLPFLNQKIQFVAKDKTLPDDVSVSYSPYYGFDKISGEYADYMAEMAFTDATKALMAPCNETGMPAFCLTLTPSRKTPVLLESTMYHYLQFGCPRTVSVKGYGDLLPDTTATVTIPDYEKGNYDALRAFVTFESGETQSEPVQQPAGDFPAIDADLPVTSAGFPDSMLNPVSRSSPYDGVKVHVSLAENGEYHISVPALEGVAVSSKYYNYENLSFSGFEVSGSLKNAWYSRDGSSWETNDVTVSPAELPMTCVRAERASTNWYPYSGSFLHTNPEFDPAAGFGESLGGCSYVRIEYEKGGTLSVHLSLIGTAEMSLRMDSDVIPVSGSGNELDLHMER